MDKIVKIEPILDKSLFYKMPNVENVIDFKDKDVLSCGDCNSVWFKDKFYKTCDQYEILNELLGTKLANLLDLASAQYEPAILYHKNKVYNGVLSTDISVKNKIIVNMTRIAKSMDVNSIKTQDESMSIIKESFMGNQEYQKFMLEFLKMVTIDYYMNQVDRSVENIPFFKTKRGYELAPIFDYSAALDTKKEYLYSNYDKNQDWQNHDIYYYDNSLISLEFPSKNLDILLNKYPEFLEYLNKIYQTNIYEIMLNIKNNVGLRLNDDDINNLAKFDYNKKEHLRKVLGK